MGKHHGRFLRQEGGFTLIETLIAGAIAVAVMMFAGSEIRRSMELRRLVNKHDVIGDLEEKIRRAIKHPDSWARTVQASDDLNECLIGDGKDCNTKGGTFDLISVSGEGAAAIKQTLTGTFDSDGRPCKAGCPLTVETTFEAACSEGEASCDKAHILGVSYKIYVPDAIIGKKLFRSGVTTLVNASDQEPDDNLACGIDEKNLPKFANRVSLGAVECVPLPVGERKLTGVNPGACAMGKEVMVGFDPGTKDIICVPAKFTSGK